MERFCYTRYCLSQNCDRQLMGKFDVPNNRRETTGDAKYDSYLTLCSSLSLRARLLDLMKAQT